MVIEALFHPFATWNLEFFFSILKDTEKKNVCKSLRRISVISGGKSNRERDSSIFGAAAATK